ncbi:sigma-70 family RNA polymerase sigma factor [Rhodoplanes sp. SY1]|uniref:sigma-70 family RNA polymerase sigma factor n=1 Tax=Rhodoplanes sp. SY1 TaxID=3166646 RepID=UPI0038B66EF5
MNEDPGTGSDDDVVAHLAPLRRYARALTRDDARADDLVHDTLIRAYERLASFRPGGNLRGWLLSILHNIVIDDHRRRQAERDRAAELSRLAETTVAAGQESRLHLRQIARAFLTLPDEQRAALHLVAVEGLTYQGAAAALGIPVGTLMSRLSRARAALRSLDGNRAAAAPPEPATAPAAAARPPVPAARAAGRPALRLVRGNDD